MRDAIYLNDFNESSAESYGSMRFDRVHFVHLHSFEQADFPNNLKMWITTPIRIGLFISDGGFRDWFIPMPDGGDLGFDQGLICQPVKSK